MSMEELAVSILVTGGTPMPLGWDRAFRGRLVANLGILVGHLHQVGIREISIDGSFCTTKGRPGDIDGYFVTDFTDWRGQLGRLRALDPTWSYDLQERRLNDQDKLKWPQWFRYRIELYFAFRPPFEHLSFKARRFPPVLIDQFFRSSVAGNQRGIVRIV